MSALLLFDQINIQRALANGTSLDDITTSGTDPTAPFTPDPNTVFINGLWLVSLTLSLMTAFFAILVDAWYCHYLSPIVGEPKVRARTRHFRYKGLIKWRVRASISFLQLLLHFSLIIFFCGLTLSVMTENITSAVVMFGIFTLSWSFYLISSSIPLFKPECPWKTPLTFLISAISTRTLEPISAVTGTEVKNLSEVDKVQDIEIDAADESRIENEVDALHWLYERSSTSAIHRLIIQALAGLSPDYIARVEEVFSPYWANIRDEKDRMLMDCMELSRDGSIRWIPRDIPNIDIRIEPLFRLEIMFPALPRKLPSRLFGEHNLDFSRKLSNTLSRTLFVIDDARIQKPTELKQVLMDALADNGIHHPLVWEKLLDRYVDEDMLFHDLWDVFTIKMCLNLVTGIYLPHHSLPESYSCSLAYVSVTYCKQKLLTGLLTFFSTSESNTDAVGDERRLLLAIVRALAPDAARSIFNSHHAYPLDRDSTIYKYRLLRVALHAINKAINDHAVDNSSKQWRTDTFWAIYSYMTSRLFAERSWRNSEDSEFNDLCWTFHADALACMASLMGESREDWVVEWNADRAKKPTFLNILQFIHDEGVANTPHLPSVGVIPDPLHHADSIIGVVCLLLDQAFSQGIPGAYEAFRETDSLRYIADKCSLRPGLIELLRVYITGASKAATLPNIQSDGFLHWHFQDLHRADVVRCICASIAPSGTERAPILCSLVSINPNHSRWNGIMESLKSPTHENSIINETVEILDDCLQAARRGRNVINQVCGYKVSNPPSTEYSPIAVDECQPSKRVTQHSTSIPMAKLEEEFTEWEYRRRSDRTSGPQ